jgi:hypothetical protein
MKKHQNFKNNFLIIKNITTLAHQSVNRHKLFKLIICYLLLILVCTIIPANYYNFHIFPLDDLLFNTLAITP